MFFPSICLCALVLLLLTHLPADVRSHGFLAEPPSRSSMWRFGFATIINYNDNELFCGGYQHQVDLGGKCGVCGDPWDGVRHNEAGGKYATGTIARTYKQGAEIQVEVQITANHKGWFEFGICPVTDPLVEVEEDCLRENLLELADGSRKTKFYLPNQLNTLYIIRTRLPQDLNCTHCVLRWKYNTGNSWAKDANGTECVGCGPQEQFYGCADVSILEDSQQVTQAPPTSAPPTSDAPHSSCPPSLVGQQQNHG